MLTRRDLLRLGGVAAGVAVLSACTSSGNGQPPSPGAPDDPDAALRTEVAAQESALLALYAASAPVLGAALGARATALGQRHADYRSAVLPSSASSSGSASGSTSASPSAPASARAAQRALLRAERDAARERVAQSVRAHDSELARTLALVAAGEAGAARVIEGWSS